MNAGSSTEAGLIAAVAADFDADLPRLVLADYYDDHGQPPLARFIRAQLAVANSPPGHAHYVDALEEQAVALAGVRGAALLPAPELPEWFDFRGNVDDLEDDGVGAYWRGFGNRVVVDGRRRGVVAGVGRLVATTLARDLVLGGFEPAAAEQLLASPAARELRGVRIHAGSRTPLDFSAIGASLGRGPLRRLGLGEHAEWHGVEDLASCDFQHLAHFDLGNVRALGAAAWGRLAGAPWFDRLGALTLSARRPNGPLVAASPFGASLHTLRLGPTSGEVVTPSVPALGLKRLDLLTAQVTEGAARRLAAWPLPPLTSLVLECCTLTQPALAALADAPWLHSVEELALVDCTFDADHLPSLLARLTPGRLRKLHLRGADLTAAAFEWLATSPVTQSLTTLDVRGARPAKSRGHAGPVAPGYLSQHFARHWRGHQLRALLMDHWAVGTACAKALAGNARLSLLRRLSLRGCRLSDSSGAMLLSSPHLQGVEEWGLARNALGSATAACLLAGGAGLAGLIDLGDNKLRPDERARLRALRAGVWA